MPNKLFGTDGVRGVPGEFPLDDPTLEHLGAALGQILLRAEKNPRALLGMDTRESGPHIAERIAAGLQSAGVAIADAGVMTTPGVAWLTKHLGYSAGVIISASHNPYGDNGVKLVASSGMKFSDDCEAQIERAIEGAGDRASDGSAAATPDRKFQLAPDPLLVEPYLQDLARQPFPNSHIQGMKIVLDCANGAASKIAPELFRRLGAEVTALFDVPDGRNINQDCGSLHPEQMQEKVLQTGAALGAAFDGDADRAIFSSASGRRVDGDGVLLAFARHLQRTGKLKGDTVVGTSMANLGLTRALAALGLRLARVPVGDRNVLEEMLRIGANLGGEQSGHIIFLDDATTGDGLLTAVKMASLVSLAGPLDEQVAGLKIFPQTIVNVAVREKPPLDSVAPIAQELANAQRALKDSGRVVLRYSGTEPLARVMVEAEREQDVQEWAARIAQAIRSSLGGS